MMIPVLYNHTNFAPIDLFIGLFLIWGILRGLKRGFIAEIMALIGIIASLYAAVTFSGVIADYLSQKMEYDEQVVNIIAFIFTFIIVFFCLKIAGKMITKLIGVFALGMLNSLLGAVFAGLKVVLLLSVILLVLSSVKFQPNFLNEEEIETSYLIPSITKFGQKFIPFIVKKIDSDSTITNDFLTPE